MPNAINNDQLKQELVALIQNTFADVPMPQIVGYLTVDLGGVAWQDVTVDTVRHLQDEFHGFTADAFRYYLPAILIAVITEPRKADVAVHNILGELTPEPTHILAKANWQHRLPFFTTQEKQAIAAFLNAYDDLFPDEFLYGSTYQIWLDSARAFWNSEIKEDSE